MTPDKRAEKVLETCDAHLCAPEDSEEQLLFHMAQAITEAVAEEKTENWKDINFLLGCVSWLEECLGEPLEDEDASLVAAILARSES